MMGRMGLMGGMSGPWLCRALFAPRENKAPYRSAIITDEMRAAKDTSIIATLISPVCLAVAKV